MKKRICMILALAVLLAGTVLPAAADAEEGLLRTAVSYVGPGLPTVGEGLLIVIPFRIEEKQEFPVRGYGSR